MMEQGHRKEREMEQNDEQSGSASEERFSDDSRMNQAIHPARHHDEFQMEHQVHHIEHLKQNEALHQDQTSFGEPSDSYRDPYDFAQDRDDFRFSGMDMINEACLSDLPLLEVDRKRLFRRRFFPLLDREDRSSWYRYFLYSLQQEGKHQGERIKDEERAVLDPFRGEHLSGEPSPLVCVPLTDLIRHKKTLEELRLAAIAFESREAMVVTDAMGVILRVNQSFTHLTGYTLEEVVGKTAMILQSGRHDHSFFHNQQVALKETNFWQGEMWSRRKNGKIHAEWVTISAVVDPASHDTHYVYTFSEITRNRGDQSEIHQLAYYDALTLLPNRRMLLDRIEQALATSSRNGTYGAIFFLDLDHFKTINDTHGHDVGDQLLVNVAQRLHNALREGDTISRVGNTVSRLGGDEFVVVVEDLSSNPVEASLKAKQVAEKLNEILSQPYTLPSTQIFCTSSIGITLFFKHDLKVNILLKQADLALYQAKNSGGNTLHFFDPAMQAAMDQRNAQEVCLSQALDRSQFHFYYQALTDSDQRIVGAEALLRWEDPERGLKAPHEFIRLAEETGLILPIGHWVLESACAQIKAWAQNPVSRNLQLAINVSSFQFRHPGFATGLRKILSQTGADPTRLTIDLNEDLALNNMKKTIDIMQDLKSLGIGFSLDGFGAGLSSLNSLRQLPVDQLKIDSSLIRKITTDPIDATVVGALATMGKNLGLKIHAQGVETPEQLDVLKNLGFTSYQGYLISHPLPLKEFDQFLSLNAAQRARDRKTR
ncbi:MAG: putative bifunctional diguanylate cyclase/phosphodiesterase [Leptospirales bacterium]